MSSLQSKCIKLVWRTQSTSSRSATIGGGMKDSWHPWEWWLYWSESFCKLRLMAVKWMYSMSPHVSVFQLISPHANQLILCVKLPPEITREGKNKPENLYHKWPGFLLNLSNFFMIRIWYQLELKCGIVCFSLSVNSDCGKSFQNERDQDLRKLCDIGSNKASALFTEKAKS